MKRHSARQINATPVEPLESRLLMAASLFKPAVAYAAGGNGPKCVAVGDLNGDKVPDLVYINAQDGAAATLLGAGQGKFKKAIKTPTGKTGLTSLALADFDGDKVLDIAVGEDQGVAIYKGHGNGRFSLLKDIPIAGDGVIGIATGDFTGDHRIDLVASTSLDVVLLINHPGGNFAAAKSIGAGQGTSHLITGDFNRDGKLDIAMTDVSTADGLDPNAIGVLNGKGNGTFGTPRPYFCGQGPASLVAADLNGDKYPELIVGNSGSSGAVDDPEISLGVLQNRKNGKFKLLKSYENFHFSYRSSVVAGDFNGDKKIDVIYADDFGGTLVVLPSNGKAVLNTTQPVTIQTGGAGLTAADLNGDGKLDLITVIGSTNRIAVLLHA